MSDKPTYEELELRCHRLASIIVRNNHATEELIRAEVKKAKALAFEEGWGAGWNDAFRNMQSRSNKVTTSDNPYEEASK